MVSEVNANRVRDKRVGLQRGGIAPAKVGIPGCGNDVYDEMKDLECALRGWGEGEEAAGRSAVVR